MNAHIVSLFETSVAFTEMHRLASNSQQSSCLCLPGSERVLDCDNFIRVWIAEAQCCSGRKGQGSGILILIFARPEWLASEGPSLIF